MYGAPSHIPPALGRHVRTNMTSEPDYFSHSIHALEASGRIASHDYLDLRSARRSHIQARKNPRKARSRKGCRCCADISYKVLKQLSDKDLRNALLESDWEDGYYDHRDLLLLNNTVWYEDSVEEDILNPKAMKEESFGPDDGTLPLHDKESQQGSEADWDMISVVTSDTWSIVDGNLEDQGS